MTPLRIQARSGPRHGSRRGARGAGVVEFALVALVFFTLLLGIADFGRWLFTMNAASEATRLGARVAVVCDIGDAAVRDRMRRILPVLTDAQIRIDYFGVNPADQSSWVNGCNFNTCAGVTVRLTGVTIPPIAWFMPVTLPIPAFPATLTRESLLSAVDGSPNPLCQ
jgi:Flp pilus assembly protein TadG